MITGLWPRSTQFNRMPMVVITVLALMQSLTGEALPGTKEPDPVPMVSLTRCR